MLVSEQKTALKRYGFDDGDPLLTWLVAAMHELERAYDWPWLYTLTQLNAAVGASALVLPSDAFKVRSIKDLTHPGIKLQGRERTRFDREVSNSTSTGKAELYCLTGLTTVQLWPVLDEATTYQVVYHRKITEPVGDGETMDIPSDLHFLVVQGAAAIGLQAENEEERSKNALDQFTLGITSAMSRYSGMDEDEPGQVVDSQGYGDVYLV